MIDFILLSSGRETGPRRQRGEHNVVMGDIVNLNRFRKKLARAHAADQAAEKRARHGRTRAERQHDTDTSQRLKSKLDRHRLDKESE